MGGGVAVWGCAAGGGGVSDVHGEDEALGERGHLGVSRRNEVSGSEGHGARGTCGGNGGAVEAAAVGVIGGMELVLVAEVLGDEADAEDPGRWGRASFCSGRWSGSG